MTTAKTPNPQSRFRLPDPPPREPDEMTAFDHVYKHGNNRYLAIHLGNQDTTLVVADRWIIAHPDADRSRARRPDLLIAFNVDPAAYHASNGYIVSEQGKPPDFVLEVASESTGATDTGAKRQDYAALGISEYWRFDETGQHHGVRLAGDQLVGDRYRPITIEQLPDGTLQGYSPCAQQPIPALAGRPATLDRPSDAAAHPHLRGPAIPRPAGRYPHQRARERSPPPPGTITQSIESDSTAGGVGRPATPKWQSCAQTLPFTS